MLRPENIRACTPPKSPCNPARSSNTRGRKLQRTGINWQCPFDKTGTGLINVYTDRRASMEPRIGCSHALGAWMPLIEQTGTGEKAYNSHKVSHAPPIRADASAAYLKRRSNSE